VAAQLVASQAVLSSTELVSLCVFVCDMCTFVCDMCCTVVVILPLGETHLEFEINLNMIND
jgi:hypothetical protein